MNEDQTKIILILKYGSLLAAGKEWLYRETMSIPHDLTDAEYYMASTYAHEYLKNKDPLRGRG